MTRNARAFVFPSLSRSEILDRETAWRHTMAGFIAALVGAVSTFFLINVLEPFTFAMTAGYGVVAFGLWRGSRVAAVAGFLLGLAEAFMIVAAGRTWWVAALCLVFVVALWNGIRGTNAEHRLGPPPVRAKTKNA